MASSASERTEEATPHKLQQARKKGEVALSRDLTSAFSLAVVTGVLSYQLRTLDAQFRGITTSALSLVSADRLGAGELMDVFISSFSRGMGAIALVLLAGFAAALLLPLAQVGPLFSAEPLKPKLSKLNPISGLKRMFFSLPTYVELLKSVFKILVASLLCWQVVEAAFRDVALSSRQTPLGIALLTGRILGDCLFRVILFFVGISVLDVLYQRWQFRKNQRMTKDEIKREYKEQEGDPTHKAARRRMHEEISTGAMLNRVRDADVIVTNPDHLAAALRFDPNEEDIAEKIKQIAKEQGIPVVRNISLARALHELEEDDLIPEDLYDAVSELLRWVELVARSKGQLPRWSGEIERM
jgi:flagellar biosynthetic protein FlhB